MKGVIFTLTGEILATSSPAELINPLNCSPKVGLKSFKIFAFEEGHSERHEDDAAGLPPELEEGEGERER